MAKHKELVNNCITFKQLLNQAFSTWSMCPTCGRHADRGRGGATPNSNSFVNSTPFSLHKLAVFCNYALFCPFGTLSHPVKQSQFCD